MILRPFNGYCELYIFLKIKDVWGINSPISLALQLLLISLIILGLTVFWSLWLLKPFKQ